MINQRIVRRVERKGDIDITILRDSTRGTIYGLNFDRLNNTDSDRPIAINEELKKHWNIRSLLYNLGKLIVRDKPEEGIGAKIIDETVIISNGVVTLFSYRYFYREWLYLHYLNKLREDDSIRSIFVEITKNKFVIIRIERIGNKQENIVEHYDEFRKRIYGKE